MFRRATALATLALGLSAVLMSCPYAPGPSEPSIGALVRLEPVATDLERPLFVTTPPNDASRLFVVEQGGRILLRRDGVLLGTPYLDIASLVGSIQGERGLLGMAFHPDFENNRQFYVNYTNTEGDNVLARYMENAGNPDRAEPNSAQTVLTIDQPFNTHNSGMIAFGPDGYLYIGSGDGGSANDPLNSGQSLDTLLGKVLRIDVDQGFPYAVPPDNPFADQSGARGEIWAYGLRNPWRFSFDRATGDLWIADVGQFALEEINFQAASSTGGENYGWRIREGDLCRPGETECELPGAVAPLHVYFNVVSQSITGGYVYRGSAIPELAGTYFFGDYVSGSIYSLVRQGDGGVTVAEETEAMTRGGVGLSSVASFGQDSDGELYIVDYGAGVVYAMKPA